MRNFWIILFVVILVLVGLRLLGILAFMFAPIFALFFGLIRLLVPIAIIGFAIYGLLKFMQNR